MAIAWERFKFNNPHTFDCVSLNMHPSHHRYLSSRLELAFHAGWDARMKRFVEALDLILEEK